MPTEGAIYLKDKFILTKIIRCNRWEVYQVEAQGRGRGVQLMLKAFQHRHALRDQDAAKYCPRIRIRGRHVLMGI